MNVSRIGNNQTVIDLSDYIVLISYTTPVAALGNGTAYRTDQYHSSTTSRHINAWLRGRTTKTMPQAWFDQLLADR